jgi:hypothetical protein
MAAPAKAYDLAVLVAAALNAGTWTPTFTAATKRHVSYERRDLQDLQVDVVPGSVAMEMVTRSEDRVEYEIQIGIQKNITPRNTAEIESLSALVESIEWYMRRRDITGASWLASESMHVDPLMLEKQRFLGIVAITYQLWAS